MSVDFTKPIAIADRAQNLLDTRDTLVAVAKQIDDTTPTGVAAGMVRWSTANNKWQKYNGSSWVDLAATFAINVSTFNGQPASYYTSIASRLGYTPVNKAGDTMTGALTLSGNASANLHAVPKQQLDSGLSSKSDTSHTHDWTAIQNKGLNEGANTQDPNSTSSHIILTNHTNGPDGGTSYWHITTTFYSDLVNNRAQLAVQYSGGAAVYSRSRYGGTWTSWIRCDNTEAASRSFAASGYAKAVGGLIFQWGTTGAASTSFPITFPNGVLNCVCQIDFNDLGSFSPSNMYISSLTTSGFSRANQVAGVRWLALGY